MQTIRTLLAQVYCNRDRLSDELVAQIVEPTSHPAAASAFASIIFAPKPENSFNEGLHKLRAHGVPLCLMYGEKTVSCASIDRCPLCLSSDFGIHAGCKFAPKLISLAGNQVMASSSCFFVTATVVERQIVRS